MSERLSDRQRSLFAASVAAAERSHRDLDEAALRPAGPGDVFVLSTTARWPIEWVLLDQPRPDGPFLAVPGDSHPLLGAGDLAAATSAGRLHLRTRAAVWLDPARLEPERRVALLQPSDLERARQEMAAISRAADAADTALAQPGDDSGYRRWLRETIEPARAAVGRLTAVPSAPLAAPRPVRGSSLWKLAAAALLLLSLGLTGWAVLATRQSAQLAERQRELEGERRSGAAQLVRAQAEVRTLREAASRTAGAPAGAPLLNLPVAVLLPDERLRAGTEPALRVDGPLLVLVLKVAPSDAADSYRVELSRAGELKPLWSGGGLHRSSQGAVQLALPSRLTPPGGYQIALDSEGLGGLKRVATYRLEVGGGLR